MACQNMFDRTPFKQNTSRIKGRDDILCYFNESQVSDGANTNECDKAEAL